MSELRIVRRAARDGLTVAEAAALVGRTRGSTQKAANQHFIFFPHTPEKRRRSMAALLAAAAARIERNRPNTIANKRLRERLEWAHGPERADRIMAGKDPRTNADVAAWRDLGKRGGRAA